MLIVQMILISAKFRTKASLINKQASKQALSDWWILKKKLLFDSSL
jgi:hypothetical protein